MLNTTGQCYLSIYTAYQLYSVLMFCLSISYLLASFLPCIFNLHIASPCSISSATFAWCLTLPVSVACLFTLPTSLKCLLLYLGSVKYYLSAFIWRLHHLVSQWWGIQYVMFKTLTGFFVVREVTFHGANFARRLFRLWKVYILQYVTFPSVVTKITCGKHEIKLATHPLLMIRWNPWLRKNGLSKKCFNNYSRNLLKLISAEHRCCIS